MDRTEHLIAVQTGVVLHSCITNIRQILQRRIQCFNMLSGDRQDALIALVYQCGINNFTGELQDALEHQQWKRASQELVAIMEKRDYNTNAETLVELIING